jgi:hypothetical protein
MGWFLEEISNSRHTRVDWPGSMGTVHWTPWQRLAWSTFALLGIVKLASVVLVGLKRPHRTRIDAFFAFWLAWPGVDSRPFQDQPKPTEEDGRGFGSGLACFIAGSVLILVLALSSPRLDSDWLGWLGIATFLLAIHFGIGQKLPVLLRTRGWQVSNLFDRPLATRTLSEFWSRRWNLAFVEMNRLLWVPLFRRNLGHRGAIFAAFFVSGLLHEAAISYPAGAGYGLPTLYFVFQMAGMGLENRFRIRSRLFAWALILLPLPILFHEPFRTTCIEPFFPVLNKLLQSQSPVQWVSDGIWALGALQLLVLAASFQVPAKLRWKEELPRLSNLNRKLVWTYGVFIAFTILAFGVLTLLLHDELLAGSRASSLLAGFISLFWVMRLFFDAFWLRHEDWPEGPSIAIGHALLTALFGVLAVGYGFLAFKA